jgi:hypothetical protein
MRFANWLASRSLFGLLERSGIVPEYGIRLRIVQKSLTVYLEISHREHHYRVSL